MQHPHAELSAYIDDALAPADRAGLDGHLDACAACRGHVAQLRATAAFVRGLPDPVPSRSLVPRIGVPAWLAPLRTLMTLASGTAVFLFIASALVTNITFLAGAPAAMGTSTREASGGAATSAQQPPLSATNKALEDSSASRVPAPAGSPGAEFRVDSPSAKPSAEAALGQAGTAPDEVRRDVQATPAAPAPALGYATDTQRTALSHVQPSPLVNPWLWLAVAISCAVIALALHRRLRASV